MDRRKYLALAGSGLTLSIAGCIGDDGENSDNTRPADGGTPAEWTNWLAADTIIGGGNISINRIDLQELRDQLPDLYATLDAGQIADTYMIDEQSINQLIFIERGETIITGVLTGGFSVENFLSEAEENGVPPDEQYAGYDTFYRTSGAFALADGILIIGDNIRRTIDAERGTAERLINADTDWNRMLGYFGTSQFGVIQSGLPPEGDLSIAPEVSTLYVTNIQDVNVDVTTRLQYTDRETAATASEEEDFNTAIQEEMVVEETRQQGQQIIVKGLLPKEVLGSL
jgi:hypothetical protein